MIKGVPPEVYVVSCVEGTAHRGLSLASAVEYYLRSVRGRNG